MKVLVATGLYPPEIGGPATYSKLLEVELPKRGIATVVLPFRDVRRYPIIIRHVVYCYRLLRAGWKSDIVYAQDPISVGLPAWFAAFVLRKKFVLKVVGDYAWEQARQRSGFVGTLEEFQSADVSLFIQILRTLERFVARRALRVVVPSKYLAGIVAEWGVEKKRIVVIYNGVSIGDVGERQIIRGLLHFSGKLLISVGRLVPWKGFDVVIKVFARLKKKFPDLTLFIAGSGPEMNRLQLTVDSLQLGESVIFAGQVDHDALLRYVRAADIFVLNTSYEGFSHQILETMAVGTPIVTTNIGGNPEAITDGVDGYLVRPGDMSALESRVTTLLEKPDQYKKIVVAARKRVAVFTDERTVSETATLLQSL
ncbi:MAG: glycosyltransferase family 4 protein [Patescibacteria group bacterium]